MLAKTTTLALLCVATNALRIHNTDLNLDTPQDALEVVEKMDTGSDFDTAYDAADFGKDAADASTDFGNDEGDGSIGSVASVESTDYPTHEDIAIICRFVPLDPLCP